MTTTTPLAERIEQAEGPSRELDCEILVYLGKAQWRGELLFWMGEAGSTDNLVYTNSCPAYTASIDAALTLVPEGFDWAVFRTNGGLTIHAWCGSREDVFAATPALALCAAALCSRSQDNGHAD